MSTPHHPPSTCFQSCPLLTTHRLPVSSHVHSSPPSVYLFPVMSTPHHPLSTCFQSCPLLTTHRLPVSSHVTPHHPLSIYSSHVHSSPPMSTCSTFHYIPCPLLATHCLAVLLHVQSCLPVTPHHPLSSCSTSSHVHSSPPTVYLVHSSAVLLFPVILLLYLFPHHPFYLAVLHRLQSCPLLTTHLSSCSTSSHVHSSPPIV